MKKNKHLSRLSNTETRHKRVEGLSSIGTDGIETCRDSEEIMNRGQTDVSRARSEKRYRGNPLQDIRRSIIDGEDKRDPSDLLY